MVKLKETLRKRVTVLKAESIVYSFLNKGLCDIGIMKAACFEEMRNDFESKGAALKGFVEQDVEKRINPFITMPSAKSIISAAMPYIGKREAEDGKARVTISMGAVGEDYHISLKRILEEMALSLKEAFGCECMVFVDTGPLSDRAVAVKAGIGYIGKNGSLVAKNGGSGVFLGYILTDLDLEESERTFESCGGCKMCLKSCPTKAITENGFKMERCISYITQKKGDLTPEEMRLMGKNIYGCDVCHALCPKTRVIDKSFSLEETNPCGKWVLSLGNREFKEIFGKTALSFRGRSIIRRNTLCALANIGTEESLEIIKKFAADESELVRNTALTILENWEK